MSGWGVGRVQHSHIGTYLYFFLSVVALLHVAMQGAEKVDGPVVPHQIFAGQIIAPLVCSECEGDRVQNAGHVFRTNTGEGFKARSHVGEFRVFVVASNLLCR